MQKKYFSPIYWLERINEKRYNEWLQEMDRIAELEGHNDPQRILNYAMLEQYFKSIDNDKTYTMNHQKEQEYEPSTNYVKGFNEGYAIAKHLPEVADSLAEVLGNSERAKGFQLGRKEYLIEMEMEQIKEIEKYPAWLKDDFSINKEDMEKEIDKDDIEPEI